MRTIEDAKVMLELLGETQKKGAASDFPCPRCGQRTMNKDMVQNALSRYVNVYICAECGTDEAMRGVTGEQPLPLNEWSMPNSFDH